MNTTTLHLAVALSATVMISAFADEAPWENRPTGYRDKTGASEWWATTWKTGDSVETVSHYRFYGRLLVRKGDKKKVKWYNPSVLAKFLEHDHEVDIQGTAKCVNNVLSGGKDDTGKDIPVQLVRSFECPISARGASVVGLKHGDEAEVKLAQTYSRFYDELQKPEVQDVLSQRMEQGKVFLRKTIKAGQVLASTKVSGANSTAADAAIDAALDTAAEKLTAFASRMAESLQKKAIERIMQGTFDEEGGVEAKKKSPFYRALHGSESAEDIANFAMVFNALFDGKDFYLCAAQGEKKVCARQLINEAGDAGAAFRILSETNRTISDIPPEMKDIDPTPDEARAGNILSRETFNVNAVLFDLRERKPGETWAASATILNNFLHPDLKGQFRGIICMTYDGDEEISIAIPAALGKTFNARHLSMTEKSRGSETNFGYYEPERDDGKGRFEFSYDPESGMKAEIDIWVDKERGYILKARAHMEGSVAYLPDLKLAQGWSFRDNEGKVKMDIESESYPTKLLAPITK